VNDEAIGPKRSLTTSTYVTDRWTDRRTNGHGTTAKTTLARSVSRLKTASNSVNVLLHRLNNTHLLTYCSARLTRTLNCKHRLQYIGFSISLCVMYTCNYSYSSLPSVIAPRDECSREHSLPGTKVPGNFRSREQKFPGTFVLGSESSQWELSLRGAKIPGSEKSLNRCSSVCTLYG